MNISIGIVGLPNVGKSTLFSALTKHSVDCANYPFCTIDPSVGVVAVPDLRLDELATFSHSAQKIPVAIEFVDIAGLVKGAAEGEGLGNQFLAHIREVSAIAQVVRVFEGDTVTHVLGAIDPLRDAQIINTELALADLQTAEKRLISVSRDAKRGEKDALLEQNVLTRILAHLEQDQRIADMVMDEQECMIISSLHFLTAKPMLYVLNMATGASNIHANDNIAFQNFTTYAQSQGALMVPIDAETEHDLQKFDVEERAVFTEELGYHDDGVSALIQTGYTLLNLSTFFTTGPDETRAWTITSDSTIREAGAAIHTDFRDKFIRAEVIYWKDLLQAGSYAIARDKGLVRTEGKEYRVRDGDVVVFRI